MKLAPTSKDAKELTLERIFDSPNLAGSSLRALKLSPDGTRVTYLQGKVENKDQYDLWEYHIKDGEKRLLVDSNSLLDGEEILSAEEQARRERQRLANVIGIIDYAWSFDGSALLFPMNGDLYLYQLSSETNQQLTKTATFETDAKFSPKGNYVSFVREHNVYVVNVQTGKEQQLTYDGDGLIKNGMAEFVAQEEMARDTGYWWSPDEQHLAFLQVDESPVAVTKRYEINADDITVIDQRYPYTGEANVKIKLAIVNLESSVIEWVDLGHDEDFYLARVDWLPNSQQVSYQWQSRDQQTLELRFADLNGHSQTVVTETSATWINLHHDLRFFQDGSFVWASERDGFKHLYLYGHDGKLIKQLTSGEWVVDAVEGIDESNQWVYFTGGLNSTLEKHLYRTNYKNMGSPQIISVESGFHEITMDASAGYYIDQWSDRDTPPKVSLHLADGQRTVWLNENKVDESHPYGPYIKHHLPNEFGTLAAEDGQTLHYRMIKPKGFDRNKKYPVFQYAYGGPHVQCVSKSWGSWVEQYMAQQGFIVFVLDNRGSARRGVKFESVIYRQMGTAELADQLIGTNYLKTCPYVATDKIGFFGWSYGGFMALKALTNAPDDYALAVSVAPVTDFALYDTHYTERYMSTPQLNPDGYRKTAMFEQAKNIKKPLLLIHGMADDNVLFLNSTKMMKVLQDEGVLFDSMIYPGGKHAISGKKAQLHVYRTITDFFIKHLKPNQRKEIDT